MVHRPPADSGVTQARWPGTDRRST